MTFGDIELHRQEFYPDRTIGGFYLDGLFKYYSLEDPDRQRKEDGTIIPWTPELKIPKETAIPRGRYLITLAWSPKRYGLVPLLIGVPSFTAIEIHAGNDPLDVEGCIAIGLSYDAPTHEIRQSIPACSEFYPWLLQRLIAAGGKTWISIS
jgi:hypothetical protein